MAARPSGGPTTLTAQEKSDLLFMREEEKLARDVYLTLYVMSSGARRFSPASPLRNSSTWTNLLTPYRLPDPTAGKAIGVFVNTELQALYDALIARGKQSALFDQGEPAASFQPKNRISEIEALVAELLANDLPRHLTPGRSTLR